MNGDRFAAARRLEERNLRFGGRLFTKATTTFGDASGLIASAPTSVLVSDAQRTTAGARA